MGMLVMTICNILIDMGLVTMIACIIMIDTAHSDGGGGVGAGDDVGDAF